MGKLTTCQGQTREKNFFLPLPSSCTMLPHLYRTKCTELATKSPKRTQCQEMSASAKLSSSPATSSPKIWSVWESHNPGQQPTQFWKVRTLNTNLFSILSYKYSHTKCAPSLRSSCTCHKSVQHIERTLELSGFHLELWLQPRLGIHKEQSIFLCRENIQKIVKWTHKFSHQGNGKR